MTTVFCFIILLISLAHANARPGFESMILDDLICDSCLDVSREAKEALGDPKLFEKVSMLSSEACQVLPTDLEAKCLETSGAYLHQTKNSLKKLFHEENLCHDSGICLESVGLPSDDNLLMEEVQDGECVECRKGVKDILLKLKQPKIKSRILESLLESCEEADANAKQCKQQVDEYAPMMLTKLNKFKTMDICITTGFCEEAQFFMK